MKKGDIRDAQLSQLISQELELILSGSLDPILSELHVTAVQPDGPGHFTACLSTYDEELASNPEAIKCALARGKAYVRSELAGALNLKRVPEVKMVLEPGI